MTTTELITTTIIIATLTGTAVLELRPAHLIETATNISTTANNVAISNAIDRYVMITNDYSILNMDTESQLKLLKQEGILR